MNTREVWIPVLGYEGLYEASNLGAVRRAPEAPLRSLGVPGKRLVPSVGENGYATVSLSKNGIVRTRRVNRLVLEAFCGPAPFDGAHAAHNDGDKLNNALTNLRWASPSENQADVARHGNRCRGASVFGSVLDEDRVRKIRARCAAGERNGEIAKDFGVSPSTVHLIRHNRTWRHVE